MMSAAVKPEPITRSGVSGSGDLVWLRIWFERGSVERGWRREGGGQGWVKMPVARTRWVQLKLLRSLSWRRKPPVVRETVETVIQVCRVSSIPTADG